MCYLNISANKRANVCIIFIQNLNPLYTFKLKKQQLTQREKRSWDCIVEAQNIKSGMKHIYELILSIKLDGKFVTFCLFLFQVNYAILVNEFLVYIFFVTF